MSMVVLPRHRAILTQVFHIVSLWGFRPLEGCMSNPPNGSWGDWKPTLCWTPIWRAWPWVCAASDNVRGRKGEITWTSRAAGWPLTSAEWEAESGTQAFIRQCTWSFVCLLFVYLSCWMVAERSLKVSRGMKYYIFNLQFGKIKLCSRGTGSFSNFYTPLLINTSGFYKIGRCCQVSSHSFWCLLTTRGKARKSGKKTDHTSQFMGAL